MTTTFSDYCATADAREQIAANVLEWTQMLCLALEQDFVQTSIKRARFLMPSSDNPQYWEDRIAEYKEGKDVYKFSIDTGRKYHKIVQTCSDGSQSVHAFVDKKTGELYKAGKDLYKFSIVTGRKYHKIVQTCTDGSQSVHAFVDKNTGELYKAASWKAPAKDVRFDLRIIGQREWVLENCDWAGGYLYK